MIRIIYFETFYLITGGNEMATTHARQQIQPMLTGEKAARYPAGGRRFDLIVAVLSLWILAGLYLDGSAHHHIPDLIETFFTPWHAVLYSGFAAKRLYDLSARIGHLPFFRRGGFPLAYCLWVRGGVRGVGQPIAPGAGSRRRVDDFRSAACHA